jgi:hypothetical protein
VGDEGQYPRTGVIVIFVLGVALARRLTAAVPNHTLLFIDHRQIGSPRAQPRSSFITRNSKKQPGDRNRRCSICTVQENSRQ